MIRNPPPTSSITLAEGEGGRGERKGWVGAPMQILTSLVTEVTPGKLHQSGHMDNNIWRKRITERMNESVNDQAVCRTAPATPG